MKTFYCASMCPKIFKFGPKLVTPRRKRSSEPICANLHGVFPCHFIEIITKNTQYLWIDFSNRFFSSDCQYENVWPQSFSPKFLLVFSGLGTLWNPLMGFANPMNLKIMVSCCANAAGREMLKNTFFLVKWMNSFEQ